MALTGTSLNAATVTGAGSAIQFDLPRTNIAMTVVATGSPSSWQVALQGTIDGITWGNLPPRQSFSENVFALFPGRGLVRAARANLQALEGGSSPTVTAVIAAAE